MSQTYLLQPDEGLRLQSGPGRDLVFKVTGGAFEYGVIDVAPHAGPPLHIHNADDEAIHVVRGRFKVRVGDDEAVLEQGGFAFMPRGVPHAFRNLTDEDAQLALVYSGGTAHEFFAEFGPLMRDAAPSREEIAACFERHDMRLVGPPLS